MTARKLELGNLTSDLTPDLRTGVEIPKVAYVWRLIEGHFQSNIISSPQAFLTTDVRLCRDLD